MKFSVITVAFNARDLLETTILSVASQEDIEYEHIIIDGGSTDGTKELIDRYYKNFSKVVSEEDKGIYDAMNKGIALAEGDWINFMNAGDTFCSSQTLFNVEKSLEEDVDFVYGDRYRVSENGSKRIEKALDIDATQFREAVFHQSLFSRRSKAEQLFHTGYSLAADYDFIVRNWASGAKFKKIELPISNFLEGGRSREHYSKAHLEAMHTLYDNLTEENAWKKSDFFEHFVSTNMGFYINAKLQQFKRNYPNFDVLAHKDPSGNIYLTSDTASDDVHLFLKRLNAPFAALHAENQSSRIKRLLREGKSAVKSLTHSSAGKVQNTSMDRQVPVRRTQTLSSMKVTVVTVVYNAIELIERTLRSVISQNYEHMEYVVIDGKSSDGTSDVIKCYQDGIDQYICESDSGIYNAMNKGIESATGDYILFMNAGDTFCSSDTISKVSRSMDGRADAIYGDRTYIKKDGTKELQQAKPINSVFERMPYCHQSAFVATSALKEHPFDETYKFAADYNQVVQLFLSGKNFEYLPGAICNFVEGGMSESGLRPYLEVLKIQLDNCSDKELIKTKSVYFRAFRNNIQDLLDL